jgi:perosamine synthetase
MRTHREAPYQVESPRHDAAIGGRAQDHAILLPLYAQMTESEMARRLRA